MPDPATSTHRACELIEREHCLQNEIFNRAVFVILNFRMNAKVFLVCLMAVATTNAYSNGAPDMACFDMIPQHGVDPQSSKAPYQVQLARNQIRSGGQIDITIRGLKQSHTIKGFLVQGRVGMTPVGKWLVDKNNAYGQQLSCGNGYGVSKFVFMWCKASE